MEADYSALVIIAMILIVAFRLFGSGCSGGTCG
jgi:hypothetical protein